MLDTDPKLHALTVLFSVATYNSKRGNSFYEETQDWTCCLDFVSSFFFGLNSFQQVGLDLGDFKMPIAAWVLHVMKKILNFVQVSDLGNLIGLYAEWHSHHYYPCLEAKPNALPTTLLSKIWSYSSYDEGRCIQISMTIWNLAHQRSSPGKTRHRSHLQREPTRSDTLVFSFLFARSFFIFIVHSLRERINVIIFGM